MENELSASRILNAYLSLHLPFSVHESAQTAICYARVFLSSNFSCSFVNLLRLLALLGHVTGSNLFFLRSLLFHAGQAKDGGVTRRQIARQKKEKRKKGRIANSEGKGQEKKFTVAHGASSVLALYTRDCWILRARDVPGVPAFFSLSPGYTFHAFSTLTVRLFSFLCTRGRILMARKRQECETPKGCRERIARPSRGCNLWRAREVKWPDWRRVRLFSFKGTKSFPDKFPRWLDREINEQLRRLDNENEWKMSPWRKTDRQTSVILSTLIISRLCM